ncbi:hypothetical protein ACSTKE_01610 [Vibrio parahaemolyticus]
MKIKMNPKLVEMIEDCGLEVEDVAHIVEEAQKQVEVTKLPVLMSRDNPTGWKLEELTEKLRCEIQAKSLNISGDMSIQAQTVTNNNFQIIGLLMQIEALQRQSFAVMSQLGEDQGPTGKPRLGVGSVKSAVSVDEATVLLRDAIQIAEPFGLVRTEEGVVITGALASDHGVVLVRE